MTLGVMQSAYPRPMYERQIWLRDAVCRRPRRKWYSLSPSARCGGFGRRMRAGMASSINTSREGAPIAFSIASRSSASGPMWRFWNLSKSKSIVWSMAQGRPEGLRYVIKGRPALRYQGQACATLRGLLYEVLVLRGVQERAGFAGVRQPDDDHPAAM